MLRTFLSSALLLIQLTLLAGVSPVVFGGTAQTTAYINDANATENFPVYRTSLKYTLTIDGAGPPKTVHVYTSTNDVRWNNGTECLVGELPISSNNAECVGNEQTATEAAKMTSSDHWASFDYAGGSVDLTITTTCDNLDSGNVNGSKRNEIIHPNLTAIQNPSAPASDTFTATLYPNGTTSWPKQVHINLPDDPGSDCHSKHPLFLFFNPRDETFSYCIEFY